MPCLLLCLSPARRVRSYHDGEPKGLQFLNDLDAQLQFAHPLKQAGVDGVIIWGDEEQVRSPKLTAAFSQSSYILMAYRVVGTSRPAEQRCCNGSTISRAFSAAAMPPGRVLQLLIRSWAARLTTNLAKSYTGHCALHRFLATARSLRTSSVVCSSAASRRGNMRSYCECPVVQRMKCSVTVRIGIVRSNSTERQ